VSLRIRPSLAFFALLSISSPLPAQDPRRLEPTDFFRVQVASDPQISPDGKHIVYVRNSADISSDRRVSFPPLPPPPSPKCVLSFRACLPQPGEARNVSYACPPRAPLTASNTSRYPNRYGRRPS
jgi:hypothetical protein